uniref:Beta-galactosidase n=1 Tax=Dendroctonus ponderosae TaxID=77166 RepID=A0AAR5PMT9_DENPD
MMAKLSLLCLSSILPALICWASSADLPTNYEYFTEGGIVAGLNADQRYFKLNEKEITIFSGAFHYFRVHSSQWRDRLRKMRAAGLNTIETYVSWNLHEYHSGAFDFGHGGSDFEEFLDIAEFIKIAQEEDLFVLVRAGPYICSEWEFGGLPSWLLREKDIKVRTSDEVFLKYVARFWAELLQILEPLQFTNGGPIIAFQVENEYGNTGNHDSEYLRALASFLEEQTLIFCKGYFDHVGEDHHTISVETYSEVLEAIITHPASVNIYMFVGSTNFGFTNGASSLYSGLDNSGLQPDTTSYDYDAPITEAGEITDKFTATARLIEQYNPVKTKLPEVPETPERVVFEDIKIEEQILLRKIIDDYPEAVVSESIVSMEQLPINNNSGQSFGYVVYRKTGLNLREGAELKISGYVRDTVLVLLNGQLLNPVLSSKSDLDSFGYWRVKDSTVTLTREALREATLDLVVENNARNNYGSLDQFQQFKGLIEDVLIDDEVISAWQIIPLEFKKSWNKQLTGWHEVQETEATPALYRVTFNAEAPLRDTYINVRDWRKGIAIINGFVLGRIFAIGPQQAMYLPAGLLQEGENDLIIFEHFTAPEYVKFSKNAIWGKGTYVN